MVVVPARMIGLIVQVKYGGDEEEAVSVVDNDLCCTPTYKVECSYCRTY